MNTSVISSKKDLMEWRTLIESAWQKSVAIAMTMPWLKASFNY